MNNLPEEFSVDELIERLIFIEKVEEGLRQSEEGNVVSNDDVKHIIDKWPE
jgi:predicted transcriptional regulator